jgi:hypothetical protein
MKREERETLNNFFLIPRNVRQNPTFYVRLGVTVICLRLREQNQEVTGGLNWGKGFLQQGLQRTVVDRSRIP